MRSHRASRARLPRRALAVAAADHVAAAAGAARRARAVDQGEGERGAGQERRARAALCHGMVWAPREDKTWDPC